jgi:hypothetical protein
VIIYITDFSLKETVAVLAELPLCEMFFSVAAEPLTFKTSWAEAFPATIANASAKTHDKVLVIFIIFSIQLLILLFRRFALRRCLLKVRKFSFSVIHRLFLSIRFQKQVKDAAANQRQQQLSPARGSLTAFASIKNPEREPTSWIKFKGEPWCYGINETFPLRKTPE